MKFEFSKIKSLSFPFFLIAGPCAVENDEITLEIASELKKTAQNLGIPFIFKASFRKANRTRGNSFSGIGDDAALNILWKVKNELDVAITTDVHEVKDIALVQKLVDIIQIPAFLCRQTDLIHAAAETGKTVNIKKGQFMSGGAMSHAAEKIRAKGNKNIILTERGNSFGYGDLVVDMRNIAIMQSFACPVVLDCTHANQRPNQQSGITGGTAEYIELLAKAGIAAGANGLFIETHPDPAKALSDGSNMLPLQFIEVLLTKLVKIKKALLDE